MDPISPRSDWYELSFGWTPLAWATLRENRPNSEHAVAVASNSMPGADGEEVAGNIVLTQLGHVKLRLSSQWSRINISFRCGPASEDDGYLSLIEGRLTVAQAVPLVARGDQEGLADCVRHTEAGVLAKVGFNVLHRPQPTIPGHVAVYAPREWDEEISKSFDDCFIDYVRGLFL